VTSRSIAEAGKTLERKTQEGLDSRAALTTLVAEHGLSRGAKP